MRGLLFDKLSQGLQDVLTLRQKQHALTATNLANAETPRFKAKVIDFERSLAAAMDHDVGLPMQRVHDRHLRPIGSDRTRIVELEPTPWAVDGNSVLPEREQARLAHNALMYRAVAQGLSKRMAMIKYAANDGR